jgi:predicted small secreted protein
MTMVKTVVTVGLIVGSLALAACNTVRGAAADINSAANCTENTINGQRCR